MTLGSWPARYEGKACALAEADGFLLRRLARRCGVYLALAALTLQFGLSFAHIHRHDIANANAAYSSRDVVGGWQAANLEASNQLSSGLADDDEYCPICFSTLLLSTSFIPVAPRYSPSAEFRYVDRFFGRIFDTVFDSYRAPFQSRAPPVD
jgi:hypothetical protein